MNWPCVALGTALVITVVALLRAMDIIFFSSPAETRGPHPQGARAPVTPRERFIAWVDEGWERGIYTNWNTFCTTCVRYAGGTGERFEWVDPASNTRFEFTYEDASLIYTEIVRSRGDRPKTKYPPVPMLRVLT